MSTVEAGGKRILQVEPQALALLSSQAMIDIAHLLRPAHLKVSIVFCTPKPPKSPLRTPIFGGK